MIQLPRRSVTRFFIPLIDVLTLLFCIFLLMPFYKAPAEDANPARPRGADAENTVRLPLPKTPDDVERARLELEKLRREKIDTLQQRLAIRVLEIDADTGKLYYQDPDGRVEIATQADARSLIERQRHDVGGRELYYLFLFPRRVTGYPEQQQLRQYERWFEGVAHGIDNPRGTR